MNPHIPAEFVSLSARLGKDPLLIQSAGGNTSYKTEGTMWVKASGTLLADAEDRDVFVAVNQAKALPEIDGEGDGTCRNALIDPNGALRPSIETTFHALLPSRFVFHLHSVHTICHTISEDLSQTLPEKLSGLPWVQVPYCHPGVPLTQAIRKKLHADTRVIVLENHGLIIAGDKLEEIEEMLAEVEKRLELPQSKELPSKRSEQPEGLGDWTEAPEFAFFAHDPALRARAVAGSYYPDHVVFLGPALPCVQEKNFRAYQKSNPPFPAVIVKDLGVFVKKQDIRSENNTRIFLRCLADVLLRIPETHSLKTIGKEAEEALLNWDAEKYRQKLNKASVSQP